MNIFENATSDNVVNVNDHNILDIRHTAIFRLIVKGKLCTLKVQQKLFMAALWNRAGHYIFVLWFLSIFLFFLA